MVTDTPIRSSNLEEVLVLLIIGFTVMKVRCMYLILLLHFIMDEEKNHLIVVIPKKRSG
ncbi:hypothetical protein M3210_18345 [Oceanobacillus luteolus]|uniref:Uncharacterized protein n=1 Tax=Oceanobacillus luteolus TaxID=1274358 RepID=A0ABW4HVQ8_9BACI|nr:hypothetical protein [Oceanobacillus luteolus]MCM3742198.1 hypothetical protein [Oceanobacillus luteolus]